MGRPGGVAPAAGRRRKTAGAFRREATQFGSYSRGTTTDEDARVHAGNERYLLRQTMTTLESTLNSVSELLTTEELTNLGAAVVLNGESYEDAASQWLADNGF